MSASDRVSHRRSFTADESGATAVEFGLIGWIFITLIMGVMDLGYAFWQWNAATKAVQVGARLAATSDPVSTDVAALVAFNPAIYDPSQPTLAFRRSCGTGGTGPCTSSTTALNTLVYGRGNTACQKEPPRGGGMCNFFERIEPRNVGVDYVRASGAPAGEPAPPSTVTVRLTGLTYDFLVLNGLLGFGPIPMPTLSATATAEDLSGS